MNIGKRNTYRVHLEHGKAGWWNALVLELASRRCLRVALLLLGVTLFAIQLDRNGGQDDNGIALSSDNSAYEQAKLESLGFFDDISSDHWNLLEQKVRQMSPNFNGWYLPHADEHGNPRPKNGDKRNNKASFFWQMHYEPDFVCQHERRIGRMGDGGKWICDPHRIAAQPECLVYSVGSNNDFSFEISVLNDIGPHCEIHTFDFGNYGPGAKNVGVRFHEEVNKTAVNYHQVGVGSSDEPPKYKSLSTIVSELGHTGRTIDIFKIDCEGCELETASTWLGADVLLRQIQVELHGSDNQKTPKFFDLMYDNGYVITHKEPNIAYSGGKNIAMEYAFLKLAPEFHAGYKRQKGAVQKSR